ncbi:hypothetical protein pEaSNUABM29_00068 [Erwinia phage pEa_SNUABM_29]|nr:hypothetical protein pEaSNUABM29_00068 [Erwinia phage pEa_SNUABM_29]
MLIINVSVDKISEATYPGLAAWIKDLNSIRDVPVKVTLAVEDDIARGVMVWEPGNLIYMVVQKDSRRGGVAKYMLRYLLTQSERKHVQCRVHPSNVAAICFFHQNGFQIDRWFIANDNQRYFRMTNHTLVPSHAPSEEIDLTTFVDNVPIFLSMAEGKVI